MKLFRTRRSPANQRGAHGPFIKGLLSAVFLATSMVTVTATSVATAAEPKPDLIFEGAQRVCANFDVAVFLVDGTKSHENDGRVLFTGPLTATIVNLDTGKAKTYNISGPTFDGGILTGPAVIFQPADAGLGDPFLIINYGRVTFNANTSIKTISGKQTNVCAELAPTVGNG
jgi:hypothetical protein